MFMLRFDMRAPGEDADARAERYAAAIEMCVWAEANGAVAVVLSEHHGSEDGYLPSPLILASAIAARTTTVPILIAACVAPLHDPVDLAEQMIVLDHISRGRTSYVLGLGYRRAEYEHFGVDRKTRGTRMEACIGALRGAFSGLPFDHEGRTVRVTPAPFTPGGPTLIYGGGSEAAVRRAGRLGLDFIGERPAPELEEIYRRTCLDHGHPVGSFSVPDPDVPTVVVVADDVETGWAEHGPHLLHDARTYGAWLAADGFADSAQGATAETVEELRAQNRTYRVVDAEGAAAIVAEQGYLSLMPLCGGTPPTLGWEALRRAAAVTSA